MKIVNKKTITIQLLAFLWVLFVVFIYFFNFQSVAKENCLLKNGCVNFPHQSFQVQVNPSHSYYIEALKNSIGQNTDKNHVLNPVIYILIGLIFLYLANFLYEKFAEKKTKLKLKLSPLFIFLIFTFIFFFIYERWLNYFDLETPIKYSSIFIKYPLLILQVMSIVLVTIALGKKIFDRIFAKYFKFENNLPLFLFSFALGLVALIFLLFIVALLKVLIFKYVLGLLIALFLLTFKEVWFWLKTFFRRDILIEANYFDPFIFLLLLTIVFLAHNFLELIRPLPVGFDDLTVYMNNPKTMAEEGYLLSGVMSHYQELFISLGQVLYKSVNVSLLLSFLGSIFSLMTFYFISSYYFVLRGFDRLKARRSAMLVATIFYTLPMTVFQSAKDLKVDLMSVFFALLALFCLFTWKEKFLKNKKSPHITLYLSAFLIGFAVAIKYTNLLFLVILIVYLVWILFQKYRFELKKYFFVLIFLGISIVPVLPMIGRNFYQTRSFAPADLRFGKAENESFKMDPPFSKEVIQPDYTQYMQNNSTGASEEVDRYIGYEKWYKKYLLLPLRETQNANIYGDYVDIGYLFLALIPLLFILYFFEKKGKTKTILTEIILLGLVFWTLWTFTASGIIWYGMSGFIFLCLFVVESYNGIKNYFSRFFYYLTIILVVFWFICTILLRTAFLPGNNIAIDPTGLKYARGEINQRSYLENKFQPYVGIVDKINEEIHQNPHNPPKVYRVGTFYKYMIDLNDRTVLDDQLLDKFSYAYQDQDNQKMLERFKNTGIKYLIIDRNLMNIDQTPDRTLTKKGDNFLNFLKLNNDKLELLTNPDDTRVMIFKIK